MKKSIYSYPSPIHDRIISLVGEGYCDRKIADAVDEINYQYVFRFRRYHSIAPGSTFRKKPRKLALPVMLRCEKQSIVDYCLTLPDVYQDTPFRDKKQIVFRHSKSRKSFAYVYEYAGKLCVNVKCDPAEVVIFRRVYKNIVPAYFMNKNTREYWNTIIVTGDVTEAAMREMIRHSFELTQPKVREIGNAEYLRQVWGINVKESCTSYAKRGWIKKEKTSKRTRSRYNSRIEELRQQGFTNIYKSQT